MKLLFVLLRLFYAALVTKIAACATSNVEFKVINTEISCPNQLPNCYCRDVTVTFKEDLEAPRMPTFIPKIRIIVEIKEHSMSIDFETFFREITKENPAQTSFLKDISMRAKKSLFDRRRSKEIRSVVNKLVHCNEFFVVLARHMKTAELLCLNRVHVTLQDYEFHFFGVASAEPQSYQWLTVRNEVTKETAMVLLKRVHGTMHIVVFRGGHFAEITDFCGDSTLHDVLVLIGLNMQTEYETTERWQPIIVPTSLDGAKQTVQRLHDAFDGCYRSIGAILDANPRIKQLLFDVKVHKFLGYVLEDAHIIEINKKVHMLAPFDAIVLGFLHDDYPVKENQLFVLVKDTTTALMYFGKGQYETWSALKSAKTSKSCIMTVDECPITVAVIPAHFEHFLCVTLFINRLAVVTGKWISNVSHENSHIKLQFGGNEKDDLEAFSLVLRVDGSFLATTHEAYFEMVCTRFLPNEQGVAVATRYVFYACSNGTYLSPRTSSAKQQPLTSDAVIKEIFAARHAPVATPTKLCDVFQNWCVDDFKQHVSVMALCKSYNPQSTPQAIIMRECMKSCSPATTTTPEMCLDKFLFSVLLSDTRMALSDAPHDEMLKVVYVNSVHTNRTRCRMIRFGATIDELFRPIARFLCFDDSLLFFSEEACGDALYIANGVKIATVVAFIDAHLTESFEDVLPKRYATDPQIKQFLAASARHFLRHYFLLQSAARIFEYFACGEAAENDETMEAHVNRLPFPPHTALTKTQCDGGDGKPLLEVVYRNFVLYAYDGDCADLAALDTPWLIVDAYGRYMWRNVIVDFAQMTFEELLAKMTKHFGDLDDFATFNIAKINFFPLKALARHLMKAHFNGSVASVIQILSGMSRFQRAFIAQIADTRPFFGMAWRNFERYVPKEAGKASISAVEECVAAYVHHQIHRKLSFQTELRATLENLTGVEARLQAPVFWRGRKLACKLLAKNTRITPPWNVYEVNGFFVLLNTQTTAFRPSIAAPHRIVFFSEMQSGNNNDDSKPLENQATASVALNDILAAIEGAASTASVSSSSGVFKQFLYGSVLDVSLADAESFAKLREVWEDTSTVLLLFALFAQLVNSSKKFTSLLFTLLTCHMTEEVAAALCDPQLRVHTFKAEHLYCIEGLNQDDIYSGKKTTKSILVRLKSRSSNKTVANIWTWKAATSRYELMSEETIANAIGTNSDNFPTFAAVLKQLINISDAIFAVCNFDWFKGSLSSPKQIVEKCSTNNPVAVWALKSVIKHYGSKALKEASVAVKQFKNLAFDDKQSVFNLLLRLNFDPIHAVAFECLPFLLSLMHGLKYNGFTLESSVDRLWISFMRDSQARPIPIHIYAYTQEIDAVSSRAFVFPKSPSFYFLSAFLSDVQQLLEINVAHTELQHALIHGTDALFQTNETTLKPNFYGECVIKQAPTLDVEKIARLDATFRRIIFMQHCDTLPFTPITAPLFCALAKGVHNGDDVLCTDARFDVSSQMAFLDIELPEEIRFEPLRFYASFVCIGFRADSSVDLVVEAAAGAAPTTFSQLATKLAQPMLCDDANVVTPFERHLLSLLHDSSNANRFADMFDDMRAILLKKGAQTPLTRKSVGNFATLVENAAICNGTSKICSVTHVALTNQIWVRVTKGFSRDIVIHCETAPDATVADFSIAFNGTATFGQLLAGIEAFMAPKLAA